MTPSQLQQTIEKNYNIQGFIDLGELTTSPTSAFKFFESLYKPMYDANDRIVLYSSQCDISSDLIGHIHQTVNFLDISNWFVLFCTASDISGQLKKVCQAASTDSVPFNHLLIDINPTQPLLKNYSMPDTMCAIPWTNLEISNNGSISPCCVIQESFGHIDTHSLVDVFYGERMTNLRKDLSSGKRNSSCITCWKTEDQGLTSIRQHNSKRLKSLLLKQRFDDPKISSLDIKFQNTCNFKCRICDSASSSLHAEEQRKFKKITLESQSRWSESDQFVQQMNNLLPNIVNIDMYGGEPFLIKKFAEVLQTAIDQDYAKNIRLHYNTNGSVWPDTLVNLWPYFQHVDIHFSIDAVGAQFDLQRGGNWKDVESNILRIKNLNFPNMTLSVMPTISIMNILYIDQVLDWANQYDFPIFVNYLTYPKEYSLNNLTQEAKCLIVEKHQNNAWPELQKLVELVKSLPPGNSELFCQTTQWFDSIRQQNFADSHPEIAKAMGYVYNKNL